MIAEAKEFRDWADIPRQLFSNQFDARDYLSIEMRDDDMAQRCEEYDISPGAVYELAKHFCVSLNVYDLPEKVELWVDLDD